MRASSLLVWLCMLTAGSPAGAIEAVVLPAQPLAADGARVHVLKLYVVAGDKLIGASSVRAAHGAVVGDPVPADDGGLSIRYRPPRVGRPGGDTLHVIVGGQRLRWQHHRLDRTRRRTGGEHAQPDEEGRRAHCSAPQRYLTDGEG